MKSLRDFKSEKIDSEQMNTYSGSTTCCEEIATQEPDNCGDTKRTMYNEDGTICCQETTEDDCCIT